MILDHDHLWVQLNDTTIGCKETGCSIERTVSLIQPVAAVSTQPAPAPAPPVPHLTPDSPLQPFEVTKDRHPAEEQPEPEVDYAQQFSASTGALSQIRADQLGANSKVGKAPPMSKFRTELEIDRLLVEDVEHLLPGDYILGVGPEGGAGVVVMRRRHDND